MTKQLRNLVSILMFSLMLFLMAAFSYSSAHADTGIILPPMGSKYLNDPPPPPASGDFVLDVVLLWKGNAEFSPNRGDAKNAKLSGVAMRNEEGRWIRSKAYALKWRQTEKDWIINHENNGQLQVELIYHAFAQDTNGCLGSVTSSDAPVWLSSNVPGAVRYLQNWCEPRILMQAPDLINVNSKYEFWAWFRDDAPREVGEIPLAIGWQTITHQNALPDDNVKKICFAADEGRSWGPRLNGSGACSDDGAPVVLHNINYFFGTVQEPFIGIDQNLSNNQIGDNAAKSIEVRHGWRATLYQNGNYGGLSETFTASDNDLFNNPIGYGTSSIRVAPDGIFAYRDYNFAGTFEVFGPNVPCDNLADNPIGDNEISSVRVPPGWRVTLYDGANCTGNKHVIQGIDDYFPKFGSGNFNDRTTSIKVQDPHQQELVSETGDWTLDE